FFFSSRRRHTRSKRDWSSDVCSSDLAIVNFGDYILKRLECLYYSLQRLAMMKKLKIKKCVNSCISRLKKKYPLFLIIVISLVMWWIGWISRGFKFIRWDTVNYGSVAEWFSGIGTIIAIFSSFYFFKEENEPRISIVNAYLGGNKIFITAINSGRAP